VEIRFLQNSSIYLKKNIPILNSHRGYDLGALDVFNALKPLSQASFLVKRVVF